MPDAAPATPRATQAARAEASVTARHLRRFWGYPRGHLGVVSWPAPLTHRLFLRYHYWWQAHLLDCLIDAELRAPDPDRRLLIRRLPEAVRWRNGGTLVNDYFDDIAWMALALERAHPWLGPNTWRRLHLAKYLYEAWREDAAGGGIPWRRGDRFRNIPANGSTAILLARLGRLKRAKATTDWIFARMLDEPTGLLIDGVRPSAADRRLFTYNQGLVAGAELELVKAGADPGRLHALVRAIDSHAATDHVINPSGGGDGGLFHGITARYLAHVALELPGDDATSAETRAIAARIVRTSADAAWFNRAESGDGVFFGPDWNTPAVVPDASGRAHTGGVSSDPPERDLSVQLAGWMVLEMAALLDRQDAPLV